jgi:hypothetical protein
MDEKKNKRTEFYQVSEAGKQNKKKKTGVPEMNEAQDQKEKNKNAESVPEEEVSRDKETLGNDYWERVAEDVASGYKNEEDDNNILNNDQEPGDNERGDKASG